MTAEASAGVPNDARRHRNVISCFRARVIVIVLPVGQLSVVLATKLAVAITTAVTTVTAVAISGSVVRTTRYHTMLVFISILTLR